MDFLTLYYMTKANVGENLTEKLGNLTVTPSTISKTYSKTDLPNYTPELYIGINTITVEGVTSNIDSNIKAENILSGTTILGVAGTDTSKEELEYLINGLDNIFEQATAATQ